jgi:hypothetical protein
MSQLPFVVFVETSNVDRFKSDPVQMARQRPRRQRDSSPSSDDGANPISGAAAQPALLQPAQAAASQNATPSLGNQLSSQPIPIASNSSGRQLDSALEALADRADEMSEPEDDHQNEVAEADASGAGSQAVEANASGAGSRAEVHTSGSPAVEAHASSSGLPQDHPSASADCIITGFTNASADTNDNKLSNVSALSDHDVRLMKDKVEMVEEKRREIARRYTQLQAEVASNLQDFMSQNSMGISSSATAEFFRAGVENFGKRVDPAISSPFVEKNPTAPTPTAEKKNGNSVLPSQGSAAVFTSGVLWHVDDGHGQVRRRSRRMNSTLYTNTSKNRVVVDSGKIIEHKNP